MKKIIGQKNILEKINQYNIDSFPRSIMLVGEKGMGKHTIVEYISENILRNFPVLDISENLSDDLIDNIYRNPNPTIYVIDLSLITEKEQNIILKFIEEPLINSFIILLSENTNTVLNTVLNRCIIFELEPYTRDELMNFITSESDVDIILSILRSPGKIMQSNINNIKDMYDVAEKIYTKIQIASFANTLTIADKINFKDNYSRFDLDIFFDMLCAVGLKCYKDNDNPLFKSIYLETISYRKKLIDKRINKELLFENFLTKIWMLSRGISYDI